MIPSRRFLPAPVSTLLFLLAAAGASAAVVGDTYEAVIAEKGKPPSQMQNGAVRVLGYPDVVIRIEGGVVVSIRAVVQPHAAAKPVAAPPAAAAAASKPASTPQSPGQLAQVAEARAKIADAVARARQIINQPVQSVPITDGMKVIMFGPVWFHPGAVTPAFSSVNIEATQETKNYEDCPFISSDLNPGQAFVGADCEFNAMTKIFYTDRSVPKKKLTLQEMQQVDHLYRVIGIYSEYLKRLGIAWSPADAH